MLVEICEWCFEECHCYARLELGSGPGLRQGFGGNIEQERFSNSSWLNTGAMHGVRISISAFPASASNQSWSVGSSISWDMKFWALVCCVFWSSASGVFPGHSGFFPSFIVLLF